jgi:hypothetical protein
MNLLPLLVYVSAGSLQLLREIECKGEIFSITVKKIKKVKRARMSDKNLHGGKNDY